MRLVVAAALALVLVPAGCTSPGAPPAPGPDDEADRGGAPADSEPPAEDDSGDDESGDVAVDVTVETVARDLAVPWDLAFTDDGRTFVTERDRGVLSELHDDGQRREIARLPVDDSGEGGLLGVAASPDFADDDTLYVFYTAAQDNRIVRLAVGEQPEPIVTGIPKGANHNGGRLAFGPDGALYAGTGDAGQPRLAQDLDSLAGKILRVDTDGRPPEDNPFDGSAVYAHGLRNVQGLAWDADGRLYASELGPDVDDAIYRIEAGANYGWPDATAGQATGSRFAAPLDVRQPPEASWSGAGFLHDGAIPQWDANLFVAALRGQRLWRYELTGDGEVADVDTLLVESFGRLRHVTQAPDGSLWVLTSNRDGRGAPRPEDDRVLRLGPDR